MASAEEDREIQLATHPPIVPSSFARLDPQRFDRIRLFDVRRLIAGGHEKTTEDPRYTITVVDRPIQTTTHAATKKCGSADEDTASQEIQSQSQPQPAKEPIKNTAVFLIPAGREAEYVFNTREGLHTVAESAGCLRLLAVSTGRSDIHRFPGGTHQVRHELQLVSQILHYRGPVAKSPADRRRLLNRAAASVSGGRGHRSRSRHSSVPNDHRAGEEDDEQQQIQIPFLALSEEVGKRDVVARGESKWSGPYVIEEVAIPSAEEDEGLEQQEKHDDDSSSDIVLVARRLYFLSNPMVIQSEVRYRNSVLDPLLVGFDYHKTIVACLAWALLHPHDHQQLKKEENRDYEAFQKMVAVDAADTTYRGLLVGLGGGGLLHYARHVFGVMSTEAKWVAVELDPEVARVAREYFGIQEPIDSGFVEVRVGDGLRVRACKTPVVKPRAGSGTVAAPDSSVVATERASSEDGSAPTMEGKDEEDRLMATNVVAEDEDDLLLAFTPGSLSFVVIDVDSKDMTRGMSCPPQEFVEVPYLETLASLLVSNKESEDSTGRHGGVLVVNVSARDNSMLEIVCHNLRQVFPHVLLSPSSTRDDSLNVVVVASRHKLVVPRSCHEQQSLEAELMGDDIIDEVASPSASVRAPAPSPTDDEETAWAAALPTDQRKELQRLVEEMKVWVPLGRNPKGKPTNPSTKNANKKKKGKNKR
jgi:hypothetical protein